MYEEFPAHAGADGIPIQIVYLPPMRRKPGTVVGMAVKGECMAPEIREGQIVVIDREEEVQDGDVVVAVEIDGEWVLRRCRLRNHNYELTRDNPAAAGHVQVLAAPEHVYPVIDVRQGRPRRSNTT